VGLSRPDQIPRRPGPLRPSPGRRRPPQGRPAGPRQQAPRPPLAVFDQQPARGRSRGLSQHLNNNAGDRCLTSDSRGMSMCEPGPDFATSPSSSTCSPSGSWPGMSPPTNAPIWFSSRCGSRCRTETAPDIQWLPASWSTTTTPALGEFNWSTQHLECEGSLWERGGVGRTELVVRRWARSGRATVTAFGTRIEHGVRIWAGPDIRLVSRRQCGHAMEIRRGFELHGD
jgi:hypothetical protein